MVQFIAFTVFAWFICAITIAVDRGEPIVEAFKPIKNFKAFVWQLILVAWALMLICLQLVGCPDVLGQQPGVWAYLIGALYVWLCLGAYVLKKP